MIKAIFAKFEQLADNGCSLRVRRLLKKMLDDRSSGWERAEKNNEAGSRKLEDLKRELEEKHMMEEQAIILDEYYDLYL